MQDFSSSEIKKLRDFLQVKDMPGAYEKKLWEKVTKYSPLFQKIPGVLCVCVGNSLSMNACHKNSDIDLFIITRKNRLWTTRALFTLILTLLGERKTAKKHAGKFCLSFFITENAMDFRKIAIKNDVYLTYWIENLKPILNRFHTFEKFQSINLGTNIPSPSQSNGTPLHSEGKNFSSPHGGEVFKGRGGVILGNICEKLFKSILLPKTKKSFQKLGKPYGIVITDDILKFHNKDRRIEIRNKIFSSP